MTGHYIHTSPMLSTHPSHRRLITQGRGAGMEETEDWTQTSLAAFTVEFDAKQFQFKP